MASDRKSQIVLYADYIISTLNRVEQMRYEACCGLTFHPWHEKAVNLWRTAQAIEDAVIRENNLPDIRGLLEEINGISEECYGNTGADYGVHSYMRNAKALYDICVLLRKSLSPLLNELLDMASADGYSWEYSAECCPNREMLEPKPTEKPTEKPTVNGVELECS